MGNLREIANTLPALVERPRIADSTVHALSLVDDAPDGYVWPNLDNMHEDDHPRVYVVIAAGAVGKSAAAAALSAELGWPLVDAAKAQVGSYSLSGLLHDALGFESSYMAEIAAGRAGVIVDALDEGHLRAGTSNFQEFLENVRKLAGGGAHQRATTVLFSRPDTAEIVGLFLTESNTPHSVMRLDFFTYEQACAFLNARLVELNRVYPERDYGIAEKHPVTYGKLRDLRLTEIAQALLSRTNVSLATDWPEVAEFLGYAPVLAVLAEYLAVPNPHSEVSKPLNQTVNPHEVLLQIVDELLSREQAKFGNQVVHKLLAQLPADDGEWAQASEAYSPQEQSLRLLTRYAAAELAVPYPATIPASLRQQYERDASQFIADHPFLAGAEAVNVVFSDFLLAKAAVDELCQVALKSTVNISNHAVGPFFYRFAASFAPSDPGGVGPKVPVVQERLLGALLESHTRAQLDPAKALFVYAQTRDTAILLFTTLDSDIRLTERRAVEFTITGVSGVTTFQKRLSRGVVVTDAGVSLGERSQRFVLGPAVTLTCAELDIEAAHLSVDAGERSSPSAIRAQHIRVLGNLSVETRSHNHLAIFGKVDWPALRPYVRDSTPMYDVVTGASYVDLRAIMKSFRQQAGSGPSVFKELLDQRVVKDSDGRRDFLRQLITLGIVQEKASHYYLNTTELTKYGVNWHAIVDGTPSDAVLSFIVQLRAVQ